jgi:hypothetical protein
MTTAHDLGTLIEVPTGTGLTIRGLLELPENGDRDAPCVVVSPSYGLSMRHFGPLSMFLTRNGFRVLRFDYTNHVGASDGDVYAYSVATTVTDLSVVLDALGQWGIESPIGVVSVSMGARSAFRALRGRSDIAGMVSLVGVVNLQDTLHCVTGEDVVGTSLSGRTPDDRDVLGYYISGRSVDDAVVHELHTLESTKVDVGQCLFPITHVYAEDDAWTRLDEAESVFGDAGRSDPAERELFILPEASHKLEHNPVAARTAFSLAVSVLTRQLVGGELAIDEVVSPSFNDIVEKHRQEKSLDGEAHR